mmetsp:Transcript_67282/g.194595  ORF Transcript_67282/g.194595 Transcript_67282/m.194595 type:complete len:360 (-) Transcript_67282:603-1682(-)
MPHGVVRPLLGACEDTTQRRDVLVVPSVAIRDGRAPCDASDLIAVIPPRHHAGVLRRVVPDPLVSPEVVVDDDALAIPQRRLEHKLRIGHVHGNLVAMLDVLLRIGHAALEERRSDPDCSGGADRPVDDPEARLERLLRGDKIGHLGGPHRGANDAPESPPDGAHAAGAQRNGRLGLLLRLPAHHVQDLVDAPVADDPHGKAGEYRDDRPTDDNQARHLQGVVVCNRSIKEHEELARRLLVPAEEQADCCQIPGAGQVEVVGLLVRGRVLRHRVHQRIARFHCLEEQATNACAKRHEVAELHEHAHDRSADSGDNAEDRDTEKEKSASRHALLAMPPIDLAKLHELVHGEGEKRRHLLQ